jgi:endoglycosylceramidase
MNEPWGGDPVKVFVTGEFEREQLAAFYERIIPAMREVEPDKYLFFEPTPAPVTFGSPSRLGTVYDARSESRIAYAPHCYPYDLHEGVAYTDAAKANLQAWEQERKVDQRKHGNIPLMCGEFGLSPATPGFDEFLTDINAMYDRNMWSWTYWSNDLGGWSPLDPDRNETPILDLLIRTYPKATAGELHGYNYDPETDDFSMTFTTKDCQGMPTEIFVPERHYPDGWTVSVEGTDDWTQTYDEGRQVLSLIISELDKEVVVRVYGL